jgi:hypothetical protein
LHIGGWQSLRWNREKNEEGFGKEKLRSFEAQLVSWSEDLESTVANVIKLFTAVSYGFSQ